MVRQVLAATALGLAALLPVAGTGQQPGETADVTFRMDGDLWQYGGVVRVYFLPVDDATWQGIGTSETSEVTLTARLNDVQLRYPASGTFTFRFRALDGVEGFDTAATQVLSIIGTDENDVGPLMRRGFDGAASSGGYEIRVLPFLEHAGVDEATRTDAAWGITQRYDAPPPANETGARVLSGLLDYGGGAPVMTCTGSGLVQVCTPVPDDMPRLNALWWRGLAESHLERLRDRALRACYDGQLLRNRPCEPVPGSTEPEYQPGG